MRLGHCLAILLLAVASSAAMAAGPHANPAWTAPQRPFRIYGNTWYVGTRGLGAILVTSPQGHVLIDGTLPENAPLVEANIRALGFRLHDVRAILNSHAHVDHAGAIAALARDTAAGATSVGAASGRDSHEPGATVYASTAGARALRAGGDDPDDPQYGEIPHYPPVPAARAVADGGTVRVGELVLTEHDTPGHTPGAATWTWRSCEDGRCLSMVYADSLSAFAGDRYRYGDPAHPQRVAAFRRSLATLAALPCDVLMTPHPEASDLLARAAAHARGARPDPLVDGSACRRYAAKMQAMLDARLAKERAADRGRK
ncbi:MBL fold metallo-hydrolase [Fulvimonas soli]|jgi:metallo-beta-lactamase class B|uniref:Metallo-beta-lactamase class B n=1 Tax=Fulvimonas soli TaxID=155197 RepID=A0A316IAL0_9GAMM|nr:MBL fold metallo-hydrolase [Fulvimonas soli]PWK89826.1 metallo-beta-lactamase class B [Fulvimonas soli]TNY27536.1 subclass B3 metallo-beta-lactamase [Fulvimonas soli]